MKASVESGREHGTFEASRNLLENIGHFRQTLEERERESMNAIIDPRALKGLAGLVNDEGFLNPDAPMENGKLLLWLDKLSTLINGIGRAPREKSIHDSVDSLNALAQSLSNMEQSIAVIFEYLEDQGLSTDEEERASTLKRLLSGDIQSRATFLAKKAKAIQDYLGS